MKIACCRNPVATYLITAAVLFICGAAGPANADEPTGNDLVGSWEREGKVNVFSANGTGKNHDASRFNWELKAGRLIARSHAPDGKLGEEWSVLIVFTKDRNEYSFLTGAQEGGGLQRVTFYKLDADRQRFEGRTDADRAYPPNAEALKGEGPPDESAPSPVRPAKSNPRENKSIVRVGPNIQVSKEREGIYHGEVTIAVDPHDPKRLLAGSMFQPPPVDATAPKTVVYASEDGGATWRCRLEHTDPNPRTFADPALAFAPDSTAYFVDIDGASLSEYRDGARDVVLRVTRTRDNGASREKSVRIEGFHDRPFLAVDCSGGAASRPPFTATPHPAFSSRPTAAHRSARPILGCPVRALPTSAWRLRPSCPTAGSSSSGASRAPPPRPVNRKMDSCSRGRPGTVGSRSNQSRRSQRSRAETQGIPTFHRWPSTPATATSSTPPGSTSTR